MKRTTLSERALVLAPRGRDAPLAAAMLRESGIEAVVCDGLRSMLIELDAGAAFVVLTEEAIATPDVTALAGWIAEQEEWSDLPFVLLTSRGGGLERNPAASRFLELLGNVTFLERPFHPTTLVSLARSALRGRQRQYEARARLVSLRESEARFRTLFDTMDEGFCVIRFLDSDQGPLSDYVHVQANPAYARHAGIRDVVGRRVREMVPEEAEGWVALYREVLLTGKPIRFERELVATGRHLELASFRVEPAERGEVAVIFQDVTDRRHAEIALRDLNDTLERRIEAAVEEREFAIAQLHEAQKLETLGQLTGGVAHDINNLLTPITGALDLLNRRASQLEPRMARLLDGALQSAERAKILVSRLLGFARRQALETRAVDIAGLLEGMRDLIASSVGSGIEVRMQVEPGLPAALADPNQLELALLNLSVNARDAMEGSGTLAFEATTATIGEEDPSNLPAGTYVRLVVSDTGCGMDELTLAKAVEPFFSTKEMGRGTGLGLSMVHGLAAQLGGTFVLRSRVGIGTQAELHLPLSDAAATPFRLRNAKTAESRRRLSLLLVDDEDTVRAATAAMLRDLGHDVHEAQGGTEALARLKDGLSVDAVVTDYMMPRMRGSRLAELLRVQQPDLPVLIVTGYAGGDLELGLPQLAKPFRQVELAAAIETLVKS